LWQAAQPAINPNQTLTPKSTLQPSLLEDDELGDFCHHLLLEKTKTQIHQSSHFSMFGSKHFSIPSYSHVAEGSSYE
jgi:hypothetical protein